MFSRIDWIIRWILFFTELLWRNVIFNSVESHQKYIFQLYKGQIIVQIDMNSSTYFLPCYHKFQCVLLLFLNLPHKKYNSQIYIFFCEPLFTILLGIYIFRWFHSDLYNVSFIRIWIYFKYFFNFPSLVNLWRIYGML